jgi:esterase/lipase superfamily enzyme
MQRAYHRWFSNQLQRDMELLVFGHAGMRVIAFPTSGSRFYEWEERGLVGTLAGRIDRGDLQLTCVDSVDRESWYAWNRWPGDRAWRQTQYDTYILREVLPFSRHLNPHPFVTMTGASLGAYHAANFALRHPRDVNRVLGMSGIYDIRRFANGHYDDNVYFNNPCDFLANEHDPVRLEAMRRMDIILAVGRTDRLLADNRRLSGLLWSKGVGNALREWDGFAHDWPVWQQMLPLYLFGHD